MLEIAFPAAVAKNGFDVPVVTIPKTLELDKELAKASKARQTALSSLQVDLRTLSDQFR